MLRKILDETEILFWLLFSKMGGHCSMLPAYAAEALQRDPKIVLAFVRLTLHIRERRSVLTEVRQNWKKLEHASDSMKADKVVVLAAMNKDPAALAYAAEALQRDPKIILAFVRLTLVNWERQLVFSNNSSD